MKVRIVLSLLACVSAAAACAAEPVVTPAWVDDARRAGSLVVAEASWAPAEKASEYNAGHIPGAIHINTDVFENGSPRWHLRPLAELHAALGALGISPRDTVAVYSHDTVAAARVWWVMHYAGVRDVRYLDGGLAAWKRAGLPVETAPTLLPPTRFEARPRTEALATTRDVEQLRGAVLVDVRSEREYRGEISGYSYLDAPGRIPGARPAGDASDAARIYQNADGTLRPLDEIRTLWRKAGVLDGQRLVFYCGGGWRSSLAYLYAHAMGFNATNYSDGWSGWSTAYDQPDGVNWRQRPSGRPVTRGK